MTGTKREELREKLRAERDSWNGAHLGVALRGLSDEELAAHVVEAVVASNDYMSPLFLTEVAWRWLRDQGEPGEK